MFRSVVALTLGCSLLIAANTSAAGGAKPKSEGLRCPRFVQGLDTLRYEIRDTGNAIVTLETNFGKMVLELYRDVAPAHADSFLARCNDGFYDGTKIHRIIKTFMVQGGNPYLVGKQNVDYYLPNELNPLQHEFGTLSMASRGAPTTAQTQYFICTDRNIQTKTLDGKYVAFGHLIKGFDVLWNISRVPVEAAREFPGAEKSSPTQDVMVLKAYRSDAEGNPLKK